jgi:hypothetical protein
LVPLPTGEGPGVGLRQGPKEPPLPTNDLCIEEQSFNHALI